MAGRHPKVILELYYHQFDGPVGKGTHQHFFGVWRAYNTEEAMIDVPVPRSNRPDNGTPKVPVIGAAARAELELASAGPRGVLKELALDRWRGLTTQVAAAAPADA